MFCEGLTGVTRKEDCPLPVFTLILSLFSNGVTNLKSSMTITNISFGFIVSGKLKLKTQAGRIKKGVWRPRAVKVNMILQRCSFFIVQQRVAFLF